MWINQQFETQMMIHDGRTEYIFYVERHF